VSDSTSKRRGLVETQDWWAEGISSIVAALPRSGAGVCRED
jgi:hypothetical protein